MLAIPVASISSVVPGKSYTFRVMLNKTTGTPQYGFQTSAATVNGSTNINNWGALTTDMHNQAVSGRNYVEQSKRLVSKIMSIPWTAPAAGTGSIIFYTSGNLVNANGSTTGDQPVNNTFTIAEASILPVKLLYFKGSLQNGQAVLSWATAQEANNKNFIIEEGVIPAFSKFTCNCSLPVSSESPSPVSSNITSS